MRPSERGWVNDYLKFLVEIPKSHDYKNVFFSASRGLASDEKLYKLVQPSGLMYGHPIQAPGNYVIPMAKWDNSEKMKLILLDSLINQAVLLNEEEIDSDSDFADCLHNSMSEISQFYQINFPSKKSLRNSFGSNSKKSEHDHVEAIVTQRLHVKSVWNRNFWAGFFQNSLLFLDVYYFGLWLQKKDFVVDFHSFHTHQEKLRLNLLQIIAAAAHANNIIEEEEKALFKFFIKSARLDKENERVAMSFLNTHVSIDNIQFDKNDSWIIKKYILELAILTVWSDKRIEEEEKEFVQLLSDKLGFSREELDGSMLAIESFIISNWEQVHFLQKRHDLLIIKDTFSKRFSEIATKNKKAFVQEIKESKELMNLIVKMTREKLSDTEKNIVKAQLLDVLKTLPAFVIIALPGTFMTLPLLLKLLPKSAFPSAFSEID